MRIDVNTGLLVGVKQVLSPFFDERPAGVVPDLVVLHGISLPPGEFGGPWIARLFTGNLPADAHEEFHERAGLRVSAHLLIRRDGEIVQFVSFNDRAWHAGKSAWQGREACNDYSIGIECEGTDEVPYEAAQYATLRRAAADVVRGLSGDHAASASSGIPTSRRVARPIRARHSIGRGSSPADRTASLSGSAGRLR